MAVDVAFTADTHFGHKRILSLGKGRPFDTIEEHDAVLIENINKTIPKGRLYFLGDFTWGGKTRMLELVRQIKPELHWIRGNHDPEKLPPDIQEHLASYRDYKKLSIDDQTIVMSHFPILSWDKAHYGSWMLHGHSHNNLPPTTQPRLDVGVDGHDYQPWLFEEVREVMATRIYSGVDHHDDGSFTKAQALDAIMLDLAQAVPGDVNAGELLGKITGILHGE